MDAQSDTDFKVAGLQYADLLLQPVNISWNRIVLYISYQMDWPCSYIRLFDSELILILFISSTQEMLVKAVGLLMMKGWVKPLWRYIYIYTISISFCLYSQLLKFILTRYFITFYRR